MDLQALGDILNLLGHVSHDFKDFTSILEHMHLQKKTSKQDVGIEVQSLVDMNLGDIDQRVTGSQTLDKFLLISKEQDISQKFLDVPNSLESPLALLIFI